MIWLKRILERKTIPSIVMLSFYLGILFESLWSLLMQDLLGLEAYLAKVEENWVDLHWTTWLAPLTIVIYSQWVLWSHLKGIQDKVRKHQQDESD